MPRATDYIAQKLSIPSELRSAEWETVDAWLKERSFFMASVASSEQLQAFRSQVSRILEGRNSLTESRKELRGILAEQGYNPQTGLEGTIKDLRTPARMDVALRTNVEMAQGWAQLQQFRGDIMHPALRLIRLSQARQPRDWGKRWDDAYTKVGGVGAMQHEWVALTTSPIWRALSRFGNPYPPFDYNSSMWTEPVDLDEAMTLGLITPDNEEAVKEEISNTPMSSLNEDVFCTPKISEQALRKALADALQGLAKWEGDTLRLADPNGTRPYKHDEIGAVITATLPHGIPNLQASAFKEWVRDSDQFKVDGDKSAPLNQREDLARLFHRIEPSSNDGTIYRGLSYKSQQEVEDLVSQFKKAGYKTRDNVIAESWTSSKPMGERYSNKHEYGIVLRSSKFKSRKHLDGLYRSAGADYIEEDTAHPKQVEGESIFMRGTQFRVLGSQKQGNVIYLDVEEDFN